MKVFEERVSEREFLEQVAERYRLEGYDVSIGPKADVPAFLRDFQPDLIARRGSGGVIVELKRRTGYQNLHQMAEIVTREPGWRFDLVIYEPDLEDPRKLVKKDRVKIALRDAEQAVKFGQLQIGLLAVSSAFEAAAIIALQKHGVERMPAPPDLLKTLVSEGLISDDEYEVLAEISKLRSRVAHGALEQPISREKFDTLRRFAYRLIDEPDVVAA